MSTTTIDATGLFAGAVKSAPIAKIRPLGPLSDFVVEELPNRLSAIRFAQSKSAQQTGPFGLGQQGDSTEKLAADIEGLIAGKQFHVPHAKTNLARLDLMMLEAGLRAIGTVPGAGLQTLIDDASRETGQQPILSYQDIIIDNPPGDLRTFTTGVIGKQEADFYRGHQMIESCLWLGHRFSATIH
ncbi:MAG: hypothetical protein EYC62_03345 [Alphaproteobacteria bacterium]|nr:MAG: hypothetical protein EYC62_03345 [Alphaproteobacteria bacterium]